MTVAHAKSNIVMTTAFVYPAFYVVVVVVVVALIDVVCKSNNSVINCICTVMT